MREEISVLIEEDKVIEKVKELAAKINKDYAGRSLHIICILKGSVFFTCDLAKYIDVPVTLDFMSVSSYGDGTCSSGYVTIRQDLTHSIQGKDVLLVEDIVDSGRRESRKALRSARCWISQAAESVKWTLPIPALK